MVLRRERQFFSALYSAIKGRPLPAKVAVTGEISLQGQLRAVGGIAPKIEAARRAGMETIIIPGDNAGELYYEEKGLEIVALKTVKELIQFLMNFEV